MRGNLVINVENASAMSSEVVDREERRLLDNSLGTAWASDCQGEVNVLPHPFSFRVIVQANY